MAIAVTILDRKSVVKLISQEDWRKKFYFFLDTTQMGARESPNSNIYYARSFISFAYLEGTGV